MSHLQVFVWVGKDSQEEEKTEALTSGEDGRLSSGGGIFSCGGIFGCGSWLCGLGSLFVVGGVFGCGWL